MCAKQTSWTKEQKQAIETLNCNVMVAASAGTGKTAVLSERCSEITKQFGSNGNGADVGGILVLTFTDAAAEEMKSRIAGRIRRAYYENIGRKDLKMQMLMLDTADICTIHSFCKRIITENFYQLGIDPDFTIIDEDEQMLLKAEALEEIIEEAWQNENFAEQIEKLFYRRDKIGGKDFTQNIIKVSEKLNGLDNRDLWYEQACKIAKEMFNETGKVFRGQKKYIGKSIKEMLQMLDDSDRLDKALANSEAFKSVRTKAREAIEQIDDYLNHKPFSEFIKLIKNCKLPKMNCDIKKFDENAKKIIKSPIEKLAANLKKISEMIYFDDTYSSLTDNFIGASEKVFIELIKLFDCKYQQKKEGLNCLDFNDLEHYALKLLRPDGKPSETAVILQQKYKYILIDEYQDISQVQQAIINLISKENNLFGVGDIKQSIYAFRQANPEIFLHLLENSEQGVKVDLNKNFRSRSEILDFVNIVFSSIMQKQTAQMDYDQSCFLKGGDEYKNKNEELLKPNVELIILDEKTQDNNDDQHNKDDNNEYESSNLSSVMKQAVVVGEKIKQLVEHDKINIYDKDAKCFRPIRYCDIAILMRSPAKRLNEYAEVLSLIGVPLANTGNSGYFETTEICDCLNILKILDNSQQDIELAAVMRSPFFSFNENQLAKIKLHSKNKNDNFYQTLSDYAAEGNDKELIEKTNKFLNIINNWRNLCGNLNLAELIWQILRQTNYLSFVSSLKNGRQRRANLIKLHERAIQFEHFASSKSSAGLGRFIKFIEELLDQGGEWAQAQTELTQQDGIVITSIHKSKGLEYPVVFVVGLEKKFNLDDIKQTCFFDAENGVGLKILRKEDNVWIESPARDVIKNKSLQITKAEEMRILYVALTRAREKLILVGSQKIDKISEIFEPAKLLSDRQISPWRINNSNNYLQWLILGLAANSKTAEVLQKAIESNQASSDFFGVTILKYPDIVDIETRFESAKQLPVVEADIKDACSITINIDKQYPFELAALTPGKQTVSKISKMHQQDNGDIYFDNFSIMQSIEDKENPAAERGTAIHLIFQQVKIDEIVDTQIVQLTIDKLCDDGLINKKVIKNGDAEKIAAFFNTDIGKLIFNTDNKVFREWPFTYGASPTELGIEGLNDKIIVQGIIDMLIIIKEGIIIVDYKTDNIDDINIEKQAHKYNTQINFYAKAAAEILNKKIVGKFVYFLQAQKTVEI